MTRSEWQVWAEQERRRERRARIGGIVLMLVSAAFMVFIGWCAIVGMVVIFG